jgi:hypothetical protein
MRPSIVDGYRQGLGFAYGVGSNDKYTDKVDVNGLYEDVSLKLFGGEKNSLLRLSLEATEYAVAGTAIDDSGGNLEMGRRPSTVMEDNENGDEVSSENLAGHANLTAYQDSLMMNPLKLARVLVSEGNESMLVDISKVRTMRELKDEIIAKAKGDGWFNDVQDSNELVLHFRDSNCMVPCEIVQLDLDLRWLPCYIVESRRNMHDGTVPLLQVIIHIADSTFCYLHFFYNSFYSTHASCRTAL